jgi:hypothetical protein
VIADFECVRHDLSPQTSALPSRNEPFVAMRSQRAQRRLATSIVASTSGGYDTSVTWLAIAINSDRAADSALLLHGAGTSDNN